MGGGPFDELDAPTLDFKVEPKMGGGGEGFDGFSIFGGGGALLKSPSKFSPGET
jgi:hypothetical protein